jgi:uncharacterized protein YfiM (DUF2279 family)
VSEDDKTRITRIEERLASAQAEIGGLKKALMWAVAGVGGYVLTQVLEKVFAQ